MIFFWFFPPSPQPTVRVRPAHFKFFWIFFVENFFFAQFPPTPPLISMAAQSTHTTYRLRPLFKNLLYRLFLFPNEYRFPPRSSPSSVVVPP